MESATGLLVGRPRFGSVAMITAYAPGCAPDDIVIREKAAEGNSTVLQVVTPSCLRENLVQATLFLSRGARRVRFAKSGGNGWVECRLGTIPLPDSDTLSLPAVVVDGLGLFQLSEEQVRGTAPAELRRPWTADLRTRVGRAAWHLAWPTVTLVIFFLLSWTVHKTAAPGGRG